MYFGEPSTLASFEADYTSQVHYFDWGKNRKYFHNGIVKCEQKISGMFKNGHGLRDLFGGKCTCPLLHIKAHKLGALQNIMLVYNCLTGGQLCKRTPKIRVVRECMHGGHQSVRDVGPCCVLARKKQCAPCY